MRWHSKSAIGVEFTADRIRAVRCGFRSGVPTVDGTLSIPRRGGSLEQEVARLAGVMDRRGLGAADVWLALPDEDLVGSSLELPPRASGAPLEQIAAIELGRIFKLDPAAVEVALWELPALGRGTGSASQYLAVACRHAVTDPLVAACNAHGMVVRAVEPRMASLARVRRCCAPVREEAPLEAQGVLDLGFARAQLVVLHHGQLVDCRPCSGTGVKGLAEAIATLMGSDLNAASFVLQSLAHDASRAAASGATAATDECPWWMPSAALHRSVAALVAKFVEQCAVDVAALLDYVRHRFGGMQCRSLNLAGEYSQLPGLAYAIEAHTGLPPSGLGLAAVVGEADGELAVAFGAALAGMEVAA